MPPFRKEDFGEIWISRILSVPLSWEMESICLRGSLIRAANYTDKYVPIRLSGAESQAEGWRSVSNGECRDDTSPQRYKLEAGSGMNGSDPESSPLVGCSSWRLPKFLPRSSERLLTWHQLVKSDQIIIHVPFQTDWLCHGSMFHWHIEALCMQLVIVLETQAFEKTDRRLPQITLFVRGFYLYCSAITSPFKITAFSLGHLVMCNIWWHSTAWSGHRFRTQTHWSSWLSVSEKTTWEFSHILTKSSGKQRPNLSQAHNNEQNVPHIFPSPSWNKRLCMFSKVRGFVNCHLSREGTRGMIVCNCVEWKNTRQWKSRSKPWNLQPWSICAAKT